MEEASASASASASARAPRQGDTVTSAAGEPPYPPPYHRIADIPKPSRAPVCLFAAVAEIGKTVKSQRRGTDYFVTLRIADESHPGGVSATFFAEDTAQLPCVKSTGDVISLHDVKIQKYHESDSFYVTWNKKHSSFALFETDVSDGCNPYQTSMKKYYDSTHDKQLLARMRTWVPNNSIGLKGLELQLSNLKSDSTFDLVCKVVHVLKHNDKWIFYVWDGTDTPVIEFQTISDAEEVASPFDSPPLLEGPPLPRKVLCTMPCVGTIMRISSKKHFKEVSYMQENGICWARFWNITCKQGSEFWKGDLSHSSGIRLLSDKDGSVVDRCRKYEIRYAKKVNRRPMASIPSNVTDVDDSKKRCYATLMDSLTCDKAVHIVKTVVRVVAAYPCRPSEVRLLSTGKYCILLTLEDPTARIRAYVSTDELVKFFGGTLTEEVVMKKMNKVLGVLEAEGGEEVGPLTRNPPWIWCLLKSYYKDKNDPWGSRRYQIYGTTIRD